MCVCTFVCMHMYVYVRVFVCASDSQDLSQCVTCKEKHITVKKEAHESLGMTVAGGRGSKSGELPIFVTSVQPHGCLARDGHIKRGEDDFTAALARWCVGTLARWHVGGVSAARAPGSAEKLQ